MDSIFYGFSHIDEDFYEELEETLIMGDLGVHTTMNILEDLRAKVKEQHIKEPADCRQLLIDSIKEQMDVGETAYEFEDRQSVVFVIGVNGVGKTTTIGKLAGKFHPKYIIPFKTEVEEAKKVAQCLRDHGWVLASHSYGHPAYGEISSERVDIDSQKWEDTVQSVIGDCDVILDPHGSDIAGIEMYSFDNAKFSYLYEDGYRYFFNVDSHTYWGQMGSNYYRGGRRNMDGYRMYHNPEMCDDLFDTKTVFDKARPTPVPSI